MSEGADPSPADRAAQLEELSDGELTKVFSTLTARYEQLRKRKDWDPSATLLSRRRAAAGIATKTISGGQVDRRIEGLFDAIRDRDPKVSVEEVLGVFDGIVARLISKRIWLAVLALVTIVPAVASLWFLSAQNRHMVFVQQLEEEAKYRADLTAFTQIINGTALTQTGIGTEGEVTEVPMFHRRLRAEAFQTMVELQKRRWTEEELSGAPATRFVAFRGSDLSNLSLGAAIGLLDENQPSDFSRVFLEGADLTDTRFFYSPLDDSVFRDASARGMMISGEEASRVDFTGMDGQGAQFLNHSITAEPLTLDAAIFDQADLRGALFSATFCTGASFDGTDLRGASYELAAFADCDFRTAQLGTGVDWSNSTLHRCLVTKSQIAEITLPPYCTVERVEGEPVARRIMLDIDQYNAHHAAEQE